MNAHKFVNFSKFDTSLDTINNCFSIFFCCKRKRCAKSFEVLLFKKKECGFVFFPLFLSFVFIFCLHFARKDAGSIFSVTCFSTWQESQTLVPSSSPFLYFRFNLSNFVLSCFCSIPTIQRRFWIKCFRLWGPNINDLQYKKYFQSHRFPLQPSTLGNLQERVSLLQVAKQYCICSVWQLPASRLNCYISIFEN